MHGGEKRGIDRPSSSREALPPSVQLVNNHSGPVGPKHCTGPPDRLCVGATPTVSPQPSSLLLKTNLSDSRGVDKTAVTIHWTGLLDWNTGLDFPPFLDKYVCIFSVNLEALFKNYCYKATVIYIG